VKGFSAALYCVAVCSWITAGVPAKAYAQHVWHVPSPDHGQTFAYGSEQNRVWITRGSDRHLALLLNFTNDPYVDRNNPREYDSFTFNFPDVSLGTDGHTYYYRTSSGRLLPVAAKEPDVLGGDEIKLLNSSCLVIKSPHGYLTLTLVVQDHPFPTDSE